MSDNGDHGRFTLVPDVAPRTLQLNITGVNFPDQFFTATYQEGLALPVNLTLPFAVVQALAGVLCTKAAEVAGVRISLTP